MTKVKEANRVFDFRMDVQSWFMLIGIFVAFWLVLLPAMYGVASDEVSTGTYLLMALLRTVFTIAASTIPVVIVCLLIKRIPDIDYAIWFATIFVIISILGVSLS